MVDFPLYAGKSDHDGASGGLIRHGLTEADVTTHWGLRATTAARTLTDLAHTLDPASLTRAVDDARLNRH